MKKLLYIFLILGITSTSSFSQQNYNKYRIGIGAGVMSYYGDVSYKFFKPSNLELAYNASFEYNSRHTFGFRLSAMGGSFSGSDRKYDNNPNYQRAINFKTHILSADALVLIHTDNGKIFKENAFISPYFFVGIGGLKFDAFADLFDENGNRYYYWSDGAIRNIEQSTYNGTGNLELLERNNVYETALRELNTEQEEPYENKAIYIPFGMGFKFRLGNNVSFNIETKFNYALSDYLDDVSGNQVNQNLSDPLAQYAADPNSSINGARGNTNNKLNDVFIYTSAALNVNFGKREELFSAPIIYGGRAELTNSIQIETFNDFNEYVDSLNKVIQYENFAVDVQNNQVDETSDPVVYEIDSPDYSSSEIIENEVIVDTTIKNKDTVVLVSNVDSDAEYELELLVSNAQTLWILFGVNETEFASFYTATLDTYAKNLNEHKNLRLLLKGFADQQGDVEYNLELSEQRAISVARYLTDVRGVSEDQLIISSFGSTDGITYEDDLYNRRVEVTYFLEENNND